MSKSRPLPWRRSIVIACTSVTFGVACYDFSLITQVPPLPAPDAAAEADAASEADADGATGSDCITCLSTSCSAQYGTCTSTPKCEALLLCGIREGCFAPNGDRVSCVTRCAAETQVAGFNDPALVALLGMNECATKSCATACGGQP